jgi:hypothetical protein
LADSKGVDLSSDVWVIHSASLGDVQDDDVRNVRSKQAVSVAIAILTIVRQLVANCIVPDLRLASLQTLIAALGLVNTLAVWRDTRCTHECGLCGVLRHVYSRLLLADGKRDMHEFSKETLMLPRLPLDVVWSYMKVLIRIRDML